MRYRTLGKTGYNVSEIGFGAWAIGGSWGNVDDAQSLDALRAAMDAGVNFIDTADVYGMGRSEKLISSVYKPGVIVATKAGRKLPAQVAEGYSEENLNAFVDESRRNLGVGTLDLLQLHCPPTQVYYMPEVFESLDRMVAAKKIRHYGVSVEKIEEALKAIEYPNVATVQIIVNMFRQRPLERFFDECRKRNVGVIVRVPLASGLLTGKMTEQTSFAHDDHRNFNRHGERFDVGETFSGVDYATGLSAVEELRRLKPEGFTMTQFALKWLLMFPAVTTVIAGAKTAQQARENAAASDLPPLDADAMTGVRVIYEKYIRQHVHHRW